MPLPPLSCPTPVLHWQDKKEKNIDFHLRFIDLQNTTAIAWWGQLRNYLYQKCVDDESRSGLWPFGRKWTTPDTFFLRSFYGKLATTGSTAPPEAFSPLKKKLNALNGHPGLATCT